MSYLSSVKCYAEHHQQMIYALQQDQMKGFDYLAPSSFYDMLKAYSLLDTICDIDKADQEQTKAYIRTAFAVTSPIVIEGLTKQGDPLSPIKSTLTASLGHQYLDCYKHALITFTRPRYLVTWPMWPIWTMTHNVWLRMTDCWLMLYWK